MIEEKLIETRKLVVGSEESMKIKESLTRPKVDIRKKRITIDFRMLKRIGVNDSQAEDLLTRLIKLKEK